MELTGLEMLLGGGAVGTFTATVTAVFFKFKKSPTNGNGNGKGITPELCKTWREAHSQLHKDEARLSEERFTNVYKRIDHGLLAFDGRLKRIEGMLDRRHDDAGDPKRGRREAD